MKGLAALSTAKNATKLPVKVAIKVNEASHHIATRIRQLIDLGCSGRPEIVNMKLAKNNNNIWLMPKSERSKMEGKRSDFRINLPSSHVISRFSSYEK